MLLPIIAVLIGLVLLVWSADRFVAGAAATARHFGLPPLVIGMVIVGFGTSAPELVVSVLAAAAKSPGIALGNAYGSNITNIALILGLTAIISPITVKSQILRKELPILAVITALSAFLVFDGNISRLESILLLAVFAFVMGWTIWQGMHTKQDELVAEVEESISAQPMSIKAAIIWLVIGLVVLVASSRMLVWGAVEIASHFGVSDLVIGLTVVAVGTSLPELASSLIAAKKGEHDIAMGNALGSNLFNTLAVVGLSGVIYPIEAGREVFIRDMPVMGALTLSLFIFGRGFFGRPGRINRIEGSVLLVSWIAYTAWLLAGSFGGAGA